MLCKNSNPLMCKFNFVVLFDFVACNLSNQIAKLWQTEDVAKAEGQ